MERLTRTAGDSPWSRLAFLRETGRCSPSIRACPEHKSPGGSENCDFLSGIRLNGAPDADSYLSDLAVVRYLQSVDELKFRKPVTLLVGENGTGKSTLLEAVAIAMGLNPEGGSRDTVFFTRETHSELYQYITPIRLAYPKDEFFLRAESFYNTATYLETHSRMQRYGGIPFHELSHGESFLSLVIDRFQGKGIYFLDEPEAALSPQRLLTLLVAIDNLVKSASQLIIATHSPILMAYPNAEILQLSDSGIEKVGYRETEHYKITKQFMDRPEQMLKYLLGR